MSDRDAYQTARQLSWPLRRAVMALDDKEFTDWNRVLRQRRQRIKLVELGITEPQRTGPVTMWCFIRLTPFGAAVKATCEGLQRLATHPSDQL